MATKKNIFTAEGYEKLKDELERLKGTVRLEVASRIREATELGDLSENAAYQAAIEQRDINEAKIAELEEILANAKIVKSTGLAKDGSVNIGSHVTLVDSEGHQIDFEIVGTGETDIIARKFNVDSPLASASIGKKKGDKVEVNLPAGKKLYTISVVK